MTSARRFVVDPERLAVFAREFAVARDATEGRGAHMPPPERLMALISVIEAANGAKVWPVDAPLEARATLLRLWTPVLCETRAAVKVLEAVLPDVAALPGVFDPPYMQPLSFATRLQTRGRWLRRLTGWGLVVAGPPLALVLGLLIGTAGQVYRTCPEERPADLSVYDPLASPARSGDTWVGRLLDRVRPCDPFGPIVVVGPTAEPIPNFSAIEPFTLSPSQPPFFALEDDPPTVPDRMFSALGVAGHEMTPMQLAERLAGSGGQGIEPAVYLAAMLARDPLPPDRPVPRSEGGALALLSWALAVAELEGDSLPVQAALSAFEAHSRLPRTVPVNPIDGSAPEPGFLGLRGMILAADSRFAAFLDDPLLGLIKGGASRPGGVTQAALDPDSYAAVLGRQFPPEASAEEVYDTIVAEVEELLSGTHHPAPKPWPAALDALPLVPVLLALGWLLLGLKRLDSVAQRDLPWLRSRVGLSLPAASRRALQPVADLRLVARQLSHAPLRETRQLDIRRTLSATLGEGGFLRPVWQTRRLAFGLTVLIRKASLAEHEPRRAALWWQALRDTGARVQVFSYAASPALLLPLDRPGADPVALGDLAADRHRSRLVLVTKGDEFAAPLGSGVSREVLELLQGWQDRVLLTPVSVEDWGLREMVLAERTQFPIVPYGISGPADLARVVRSDSGMHDAPGGWLANVRRPFEGSGEWSRRLDWLMAETERWRRLGPGIALPVEVRMSVGEASSPVAPEQARQDQILSALDVWLGRPGMLWMGACASYPVLRFPLTAWIGVQLSNDLGWDASARTQVLARLCRLPWFVSGRMPLWLRDALRARMDPNERDHVLAIFRRFYGDWDVAQLSDQDAEAALDWRLRAEHDPDLRERLGGLPGPKVAELHRARELLPERRQRVLREMLIDRGMIFAGATVVGLELWRAWPDRTALPLAPGAWLHVAMVAGLCILGLVFTLSMRMGRDR